MALQAGLFAIVYGGHGTLPPDLWVYPVRWLHYLISRALTALIALHIAGAAYFGIPLWYGLLFPLGYSAGALLAIDSIWRRLRRRVTWKGRTYP